MPSRWIREGIITSERIEKLDWPAEVFYRRLLNKVDDFGLYDARPGILRSNLFPLRLNAVREADVQRWIAACVRAGLIVLYEASGKPYLKVLDTRWPERSEPKCPLPSAVQAGGNGASQRLLVADDLATANNCMHVLAEPVYDIDSISIDRRNKLTRENKARGSLEELTKFAVDIGLPSSDGEACFHKWEGNGWKNGGKPILDWRATIRAWRAHGYLPSQKNGALKRRPDDPVL